MGLGMELVVLVAEGVPVTVGAIVVAVVQVSPCSMEFQMMVHGIIF